MARGGARNRSGPQADPTSGRSDQRGFFLTALPAAGYEGDAPEFPLSKVVILTEETEGEGRDRTTFKVRDDDATDRFRERELELWEWAWSTPQACAWSQDRWRWHTVAMWVRTAIICEGADAKAADKNSLHRFADQIGLTPAGLKENGWEIADLPDPTAGPGDEPTEVEDDEDDPRNRLTVITGGAA